MKGVLGFVLLMVAIATVCGCLVIGLPSWLVATFAQGLREDGWGYFGDGVEQWLLGNPQPTGHDGDLGDTNPGPSPGPGGPGSPIVLPIGACGPGTGGPVGQGNWHRPTGGLWLSGWQFHAVRHPGIDIGIHMDQPIEAADSGVIVWAGWDGRGNNGGYGNTVVIDHNNGWRTRYAHLNQILVTCQQFVQNGELIGLGGSTGNSTGPHLHFEASGPNGRIDPCVVLWPGQCAGGIPQ